MSLYSRLRRYYLRKKHKYQRDLLKRQIRTGGPPRSNGSAEKLPVFSFIIDVLGVCNLRCPSCPTGNWGDSPNPKGLMGPELLTRIMDKALLESEILAVSLYNWTEPVLHPRLPELIRIVQSRHIPCTLSSNLNLIKNMDAILEAEPYQFHISLSGFTQEVYGHTHRGGNIERVKENMIALAAARRRTRSKTYVKVIFHRYVNNAEDEEKMKSFAEDLGFRFEPNWAILMPLEKSMAYVDPKSTGVALTEEDLQIADNLALDLRETFALAKQNRNVPCPLQDEQIVMDCEGNVQLCCGVYDSAKYSLGNFLDHPLSELHQKKYKSSMCGKCMSMGAHVYLTSRPPEFDRIAIEKRLKKKVRSPA